MSKSLEKNSSLETYMRTVREVVDRMDQMVAHVSIIRRLSGLLKTEHGLDDICHRIAAVIVQELEIEGCAVLLRQDQGQLAVKGIKSVFGEFGEQTDIQPPVSMLKKFAAIAADSNRLVVVDDIKDSQYMTGALDSGFSDRSLIGLPLIDQDRVLGVLCATHSEKGYFSEKRQRNLNIIAEHVSVVVVTAQLHNELRNKNQWLERRVDQRTVQLQQINNELVQKSSQLQKFEENYRDLVENSSLMMLRVDERGNVLEANKSLCSFLGLSLDDLQQKKIFDFVKEEDCDLLLAIFHEVIEQGQAKGEEFRMFDRHRKLKYVQVNASAQYDSLGKYTGVMMYLLDVTDKKLLEHQLSQSCKMEVIGTLASGIAHDFNNILGGIVGYASYLKNTIEPGNKMLKHIETIEKSANRATRLTKQLLRLSRDDQYKPELIKLNQIINESMTLLNGSISENINVELNLAQDLENIIADPTQMQQMVMNLCINAVNAMPDGGILELITANVHLDQNFCQERDNLTPGDYVQLVVRDTGIGMSPEVISKIFDPFFTTKKATEGTGLGLSMVVRIIASHKGTITVESQSGGGSTFAVYLPVARHKARKQEKQKQQAYHGHETILVVDDEAIIRQVASDILQSLGYEVMSAASGPEALSIYDANADRIDLIILDMLMPGMSGCEVLERLKQRNNGVRTILSSGFSQDTEPIKSIRDRELHFLQKPYSLEEISEIVRKSLDR